MYSAFSEGMRVQPVERLVVGVPDDEADPQPGEVGIVILVDDYNGDIHVQFPRAGIGVYNPDELEIVAQPGDQSHR